MLNEQSLCLTTRSLQVDGLRLGYQRNEKRRSKTVHGSRFTVQNVAQTSTNDMAQGTVKESFLYTSRNTKRGSQARIGGEGGGFV